MWPDPQFPAALATLTGKTLSGKSHFLCSVEKNPPAVFYKKGVNINFAKFIGKHLAQVFPSEFCKIYRNTDTSQRLLLTLSFCTVVLFLVIRVMIWYYLSYEIYNIVYRYCLIWQSFYFHKQFLYCKKCYCILLTKFPSLVWFVRKFKKINSFV